ncbi:mRNA cap guanine-N7 methyltransferase [Sitophilus oryzae]|uniref:mRNA cap guanine-N(7) methyltransferase n=1 Tax=Sitophilus oryzae TaxID=7048 RepID=A0A6J2XU52_SITOR|nr:mRNA cap guanine-N7 methyltransferase [Sitophilus oryzae]
MSENGDDLEQTLVLAAAAADSLQYEDAAEESHNEELPNKPDESEFYSEDKEEPLQKKKVNEEANNSPNYYNHVNNSHSVKKRNHEETDNEPQTSDYSHSHVVATHYNLLEEKGLQERYKSRIIYLRNFHNWIKSMLINQYITKIKEHKKQHNPPIRVHDMCCGKGGDLSKWKKGNITYLICSDIAEVSLEHCRARYDTMKHHARRERGGGHNMFSLEVIAGDCTKVRLREKYSDPSMKLDLVSCQFAFHYSFESLPQAENMLRNASECLQPGGYFIGTIPDSNEIVARARKSKSNTFGNKVLEVELDFDPNDPPLFGAKYNFKLDGVVNCPEFLVHFPTFVKLAKKFGLKLVRKEKFLEFFDKMKHEGRQLLSNMRALEMYPPNENATLLGDEEDYIHAKEFIERQDQNGGPVKIGTLSKSEWETSSLYLTFAFEKVKNTWNADGTPCFDI